MADGWECLDIYDNRTVGLSFCHSSVPINGRITRQAADDIFSEHVNRVMEDTFT